MKKAPAVEDFAVRYRMECAHSRHVCATALRLFDETARALSLHPSLRPLLETAALLHDVGYWENPAHHASHGAELIRQSGIRGFSPKEVELVAAMIAGHTGDHTPSPPIPGTARDDAGVIEQGAALLRIADGLDSSHLQDIQLVSVGVGPKVVTLIVDNVLCPAGLSRAKKKSDVFCRVFMRSLRIRNLSSSTKNAPLRFSGIVRPGDSVEECGRRILFSQYRIVTTRLPDLQTADAVEALHDIRVALRRFRTALKLFYPKSRTRRITAVVSAALKALGPHRDLDVWMETLTSTSISESTEKSNEWYRYVGVMKKRHRESLQERRCILEQTGFLSSRPRIGRFLRNRIGGRESTRGEPLAVFAEKKVTRALTKAARFRNQNPSPSAKIFHALRKKCRTARYICEFFSPVVGEKAHTWAQRCEKIADSLGVLHDIDTHLADSDTENPLPAVIRTSLTRKRRVVLRKAYRRLSRLDEISW